MNKLGGLLLTACLLSAVNPVFAEAKKIDFVSDTIILNASVPQVWEAIKVARIGDPTHRRLVSAKGPDYVLDETFNKIPVLGNVYCRYSEHEVSDKKLQYQMINSDKFVAFQGEWELCPIDSGKQTALKLSSYVDTGSRLPFADKITRDSTRRSVEDRLAQVKTAIDQTRTAQN